ncbi:hypothetical protein LP419_04700 [Massilia sp. H-1]|nr:hypothetical protein LP419_04700 [Massilia sp. H-1]
MLPAWLEAFSRARGVASSALAGAAMPSALVWLRLDQGIALQTQVAAVRAHCGALPIVVMSDTPDDDQALSALSAQARGYCNSHAGADILTKVASVVSQGGLWIGETLMHRLLAVQQHIRLPEAAARPRLARQTDRAKWKWRNWPHPAPATRKSRASCTLPSAP